MSCKSPSKMVSVAPTVSNQGCCNPCTPQNSVLYDQSPCTQSMHRPVGESKHCPMYIPDTFAKTDSNMVFPDKGYTTPVFISNVNLAVGQPLTSYKYGTLYVESIVDEIAGEYELINRDIEDPQVIGRPIPSCHIFFLGIPSSITVAGGSQCNFLVADFTVPEVGGNAPARVESLAGYALNDKVYIRNLSNPSNAYSYLLVGFQGTDTIILKNDGQGGTPFDTIFAKSSDEYAWCVEGISDQTIGQAAPNSSCVRYVLGLDNNLNIVKITTDTAHSALVFDDECGGYANRVLPDTTVCENLETCFQLAPSPTCIAQVAYISTSNNARLLAEAAAMLRSENSDPIIEVCGKPFALDLSASNNSQLKIIPAYPVTEVEFFEAPCIVCIPTDCCVQCEPQVANPVDGYSADGRDRVISVAIPTSTLSGNGEYLFSLVYNNAGNTAYTFQHGTTSGNPITAAFNSSGGSISIPTGAAELAYEKFDYSHSEVCAVNAVYGVSFYTVIANLPSGVEVGVNLNGQLITNPCDNLNTVLDVHQLSIYDYFVGPSANSSVSSGQMRWGPALASAPHTNKMGTGYDERRMSLSINQRLAINTSPYIRFRVTSAPSSGDFIYITVHTTSTFDLVRI